METPFIKPTKEQCLEYFKETVNILNRTGYRVQVYPDIIILQHNQMSMVLTPAETNEYHQQAENLYFFYQGEATKHDCYIYLISGYTDQF